MHAAGSSVPQVVPVNGPRPLPRHEQATSTGRAARVDIGFELQPVPRADLPPLEDDYVDFAPRARSELVCRMANIVIASIALLVTAPLMAVLALAIRLTSPGPVIYSQKRIGVDRRFRDSILDDRRVHDLGGRPFMMHKFRTMTIDAEPNGKAVWATVRDPRVTRIGRFLRSTRLDELPQMWNVIKGDMNIVGPRPERPSIFADLRVNIPRYALRQRVKPGITGWAQVNQAYDSCVDDVRRKVQLDLEYMARQSLLEDLRIMTRTLPVMFGRKGGW